MTALEHFELPAGGGAVAAVQLRKLAGAASFFCALGSDRLAQRALDELRSEHGLELHAARRERPQRRAFTHLDLRAERTITVLGERLVPHGEDPLPWASLAQYDGVYVTGGDAAAVRAARAARVVVATARAADALASSGVTVDVLVGSASDPKEGAGVAALAAQARWTVLTRGAQGGSWEGADGSSGSWPVHEPPGPPVDAYGCGDSFAAGLTYGLAAGRSLDDALALAARCGAYCLTGRGPYEAQLTLAG
ncbi:MAG: PfkB domain protein [Conexibacter sp.]|nr:PfkB domain protein [Conexibacter sp.]